MMFLQFLNLVLVQTLKTTRSCSPSCRTVPSSFIRRTKAMAKFFSLLSLANGHSDGCLHSERERVSGGEKNISKINMSGPEEEKLMICWTSVCNGCSASLPKCIQLSGPFSALLFSRNQRRGVTMNCYGSGKWAGTHTLGKSGV